MRKFCAAILLAFCEASVQASSLHQERVLTLTNDRNSAKTELFLLVEDSKDVSGLLLSTTVDGQKAERELPISVLTYGEGVVLEKQGDLSVLTMRGMVDSEAGRGTLVFRLINGESQEPKFCRLSLKRPERESWLALSFPGNRPMTTARIIFAPLGIRTVEGICP